MSHPTSQPTSFPISDALANGFQLTLSQLPTEAGERVAAQVANYLKTNYNIEFPCNGAGTPLAKRRAVHVTGPSPMLRLIAKKENHELILQLNNMVKTITDMIVTANSLIKNPGKSHLIIPYSHRIKVLGEEIARQKKDTAPANPNWDRTNLIAWNNALSIICEGCVVPIFDKSLDAQAQSEQRAHLHKLLQKLEELRPEKLERIAYFRYLVRENYYPKNGLTSLIMEDFISHDKFQTFLSTLNALFDCCQFVPHNPLNPPSNELLELINNSLKP